MQSDILSLSLDFTDINMVAVTRKRTILNNPIANMRETRSMTKKKENVKKSNKSTTLLTTKLGKNSKQVAKKGIKLIERKKLNKVVKNELFTDNVHYLVQNKSNKDGPFLISKTAYYWTKKYLEQMNRRCQSSYGLYMFSDFDGFGQVEVIENFLRDLNDLFYIFSWSPHREKKKNVNYILCFRRLESLNILLEHSDEISMINDCDHYSALLRLIGSIWITTLRNILSKSFFVLQGTNNNQLNKEDMKLLKLTKRRLPNFELVLERAIKISHILNTIGDACTTYPKILSTIYQNWLHIMENKQILMKKQAKRKKKETAEIANVLNDIELNTDYTTVEFEHFDFILQFEWYCKQQEGIGGDNYNISKWSREQKRSRWGLRLDHV
ncbi:unnamed protein product [Didymodactylos carnosus]|uniref:Uncharacterized protein n=1 Tax=Didymodactylos carnosus TaxID=1234261 RepID=A0A815CQE8_9BILA|nr:unnamed protein product [Didymodactylos carnosus]CAF1287166.1 unnamed protein product [Didymodactylos carnosus]CAF3777557.1 unnamed protein product [Didymodactylos carnosus]CAF4089354.1 unnamed protein product [Didymodactylos carnosus]